MVFANKDHKGYFRNPSKPGITDELRIERQQALWIFRVTSGTGFPIDDAAQAINFADGIHISQEVTSSRKALQDFDLQVILRILDADAIVLRKALQQVDALMDQAIPVLAFLIFKGRVDGGQRWPTDWFLTAIPR
jgi:hypothetical protein